MPLDAPRMDAEEALVAARAAIAPATRPPERAILPGLIAAARLAPEARREVVRSAQRLLDELRSPGRLTFLERFLAEYSLSGEEGTALLGLAEAYLRIPDALGADALIRDKLARGDWKGHLGQAGSLVVNSATLGLLLTQALTAEEGGVLRRAAARLGEPAIRAAVAAAMQRMGEAFVLGRDIDEALRRADARANREFRYSFDMLGEAARTAADAAAYQEAYRTAIARVGEAADPHQDVFGRDGVSVKLSALHPRYEPFKAETCVPALTGRLIELARLANEAGVGLTVDAEESERLEMSLSILEGAARDPSLAGWDGLGLAVQAYQKRARPVIAWAAELAGATGRRLVCRLVKGAYWDSEIKRAQVLGLADYPVFTRKAYTDVSYLACARAMLAEDRLYPAFATHNALTVATVLEWAPAGAEFEFQRLHGMGEGLYDGLMAERGLPVRVYAPVGGYRELLAYLVRRLLENGANSSFVHQLGDRRTSDDQLLADPVAEAERRGLESHPAIPRPPDLLLPRRNSAALDLADPATVAELLSGMVGEWAKTRRGLPIIAGREAAGETRPILDPSLPERILGETADATASDIDRALASAWAAQRAWGRTSPKSRAEILERWADLIEGARTPLMVLLVREAGKTIADAQGEVREATDFCRYYAAEARRLFAPHRLPGPTGETNELALTGRGVFACISPWNFPLAIFTGQVAAALAAGNAVAAKPAPQTPLVGAAAIRLALEAGAPPEVLAFLPGGAATGAALVADARVAGVAFTGSTSSARRIARSLLEGEGRPLVPLIAETGGVNAMLADSTALPEQVTADVVTSAFLSAGQRCSALRLLLLQEDVAEGMLEMIEGATAELVTGDPGLVATDLGPVIDADAQGRIEAHLAAHKGRILFQGPPPAAGLSGHFVRPTAIRLDRIGDLATEVFGPVLHVATWKGGRLEETIGEVMRSGYGLTMGVHSRLGVAAQAARTCAAVGNLYVNRSMIGAVVGVQPFGGEGLSGTGPKAGGPHYLPRFAVERTVSIDTTSAGGNASLLSLED